MRDAALAAIGIYQRYISPHKGFCCAYRAHTGRAGCSALGARAIRRWGVRRGVAVLKLRLKRCGEAHRRCAGNRPRLAAAGQRGDCDLGFVPDDGGCCDATDACDCSGCDLPARQNKPRAQDKRRKPKPPARWDDSAL